MQALSTWLDRLMGQQIPAADDFAARAIGAALACWGAWYALNFVIDSWRYDEVAQGMLRVPLSERADSEAGRTE